MSEHHHDPTGDCCDPLRNQLTLNFSLVNDALGIAFEDLKPDEQVEVKQAWDKIRQLARLGLQALREEA